MTKPLAECRVRCTITVLSEEGLGQKLHDHAERAGLADAATSEPDGAVVVGWRGHWQEDGGFVKPRVEALLHGEGQESHGVDLLLGACGVGEQLQCDGRRSLHCQGQWDPLWFSRQRSAAGHRGALRLPSASHSSSAHSCFLANAIVCFWSAIMLEEFSPKPCRACLVVAKSKAKFCCNKEA